LKKQKSIKDISDKQIDNFLENIKEKAKKNKKDNNINPDILYKNNKGMMETIIFIGKMQKRYKNIDWEEIACQIITKYYEQEDYIQEYNSNLRTISAMANDIYGEHNNV